MSLLVVGLSHRSAPIAVLEQAAVLAADAGKVLCELLTHEHVAEALLLSTCNRVEVYAVVHTFHGGLSDIVDVLACHAAMEVGQLSGYLYVRYAAAAVEHLFSVAAGLDSMVVGEQQILRQLRVAYASAEQAGTVGHTLHEVVQQSLRASKRIRNQTTLDAAGASVISEALAEATTALGCAGQPTLVGRRALVIGAGSMGHLATAWLRRASVAEIMVCNRTQATAQRLVARCQTEGTPTRAVELAKVAAALSIVDLVICCTSATDTVLGVEHFTAARRHSCGTLVVCDLGLPRNVEPAVGDLPGVTLLDLTNLARRIQQRTTHSSAIDTAHRLITEEMHRYLAAQRTATVIPTLTALHKRAEQVVDTELVRLANRLPGLHTAVHDELACTLRRVVNKLLHAPTVRIKQLAETSNGPTYTDALRELFALDPQAAAAIATTSRVTNSPHTKPQQAPQGTINSAS